MTAKYLHAARLVNLMTAFLCAAVITKLVTTLVSVISSHPRQTLIVMICSVVWMAFEVKRAPYDPCEPHVATVVSNR